LVPSHAIFNTPLKVNLTFEERPTPENYFHFAADRPLAKTLQVWRVQTRKFPEIDPGLVSNAGGFPGALDAEVISSGINSKGPDSVALARDRNFFLWGFSGSPSDMTPEARKCFINALCYIMRFDGQNRDRPDRAAPERFKFLAAPAPESPAGSASRPDAAPPQEPSAADVVVAQAELTPATARPGETVTFIVRVKIAPTWHIYAFERSEGAGIPTTLKWKSLDGVAAEGEWTYAEPTRDRDGQRIHEAMVEFRHTLRVRGDTAPGPIRVSCELGYQACDPHLCRPPARVELAAPAEIIGPATGK
jgi:Disulphide bond corrector protein DsbC